MKKWLPYFVVVLSPFLFVENLLSVICRPEYYESEVNSFFEAYQEHLQRRALRKALKKFIKAREERVANMRAFTLRYEPMNQNILGYGMSDEALAIVTTYKSWLVYRIDAAVMFKGESEGREFRWLQDHLQEYKNTQQSAALMTFELDEEAMFHQYMKRKLNSYPSRCVIA